MKKIHYQIGFILTGIAATIWFLIRVIPKPARATYPCMQVAAPFMSALVIYLISVFSTILLFKKLKGKSIPLKLGITVALVTVIFFSFDTKEAKVAYNEASYFVANQPVGVAKGIFPGRVVWVHNPDATNESMSNTGDDLWSSDANCNQAEVEKMLESSIKAIAGKDDITEAWNAIFVHFNKNHGKGETGYTAGEKIAVKINLTNSCCFSSANSRMDASPQLVLALLKQLVDVAKVNQSDIWIGDNYRRFRDEYYDKCAAVYPDVHYVDGNGGDGREQTVPSSEQLLVFSDKQETSSIPQHYVDASYLINMPCLKSHNSAGITLAAKNHQGSVMQEGGSAENQSAFFMHYCLPDQNSNTDQYRHLVDYMGHEHLGGKTMIYIVDGLWAGKSWEGYVEKWSMPPFNGDYPSSLFVSLDAVAIESVGYDFLLAEYANKSEKYPYMTGADDYIKQAADPSNWPSGITYDPEGDGTPIASLGVFEHWNNVNDKQYSRNLGTGTGIELHKVSSVVSVKQLDGLELNCYPNPFTSKINVSLKNPAGECLKLKIHNLKGQLVYEQGFESSLSWEGAQNLSSGTYLVSVTNSKGYEVLSTKLIKK